ncbi:MAG: Fur family transcriptional regulator [Patescibacteria group bacterium]
MHSSSSLVQILKKNKLSLTKPRESVFKFLATNQKPLTIKEIALGIQNVDRASVYRTVELFENLGIIKKVHVGFKYKVELSDIFQPHHHHIYCTQCGQTFAFEEPEFFEKYIERLGQKFEVEIKDHSFELEGICKSCKNN